MKTQYKRFISEVAKLSSQYEKIEITLIEDQDPNINIILYDKTPQCIQFSLPKEYPFQAPILYINNKPFLKNLPHTQLTDYRKKIRKPLPFTGECLHCNFILKGSFWSPALGMEQVLQEVAKVQKTRRIIQEYILLLHLTKQKQLPQEIADIIHEFL
jgi:ubiquitin-protein ligase